MSRSVAIGLGERGPEMKRITWALVVAVLLLAGPALPADAGGGPGGGYRRGGPYPYRYSGPQVFIGGLDWWWGTPYPYYDAPPLVIQQAPAPPQQAYWYFCQGAGAYYPYVKECPGGWMTVVPTPQ